MTVGIVDTTVIIHYFRNYPAAQNWIDTQPTQLSIVSFTWMEVMQGAASKEKQAVYKSVLNRFSILYTN